MSFIRYIINCFYIKKVDIATKIVSSNDSVYYFSCSFERTFDVKTNTQPKYTRLELNQ